MLIYLARISDNMWNIEYISCYNAKIKFIKTLNKLKFYLIPGDKIISYRVCKGNSNITAYDIDFSDNGEIVTRTDRDFRKIPKIDSVKRAILLDAEKSNARTCWYDPQYSFDDFISSVNCGLDIFHVSDIYKYKVADDHYAFYNRNGKEQGFPYNMFAAHWFNKEIWGNVLIFKATEYGDMLDMSNKEINYYQYPKPKQKAKRELP